MRLINTRTLGLQDFSLTAIPEYAILSHTWGDDEVSFQDMSLASPDLWKKKGFNKIQRTCKIALEQGLQFAWIDTCCIDKSSSAELTESINSMFRWYSNAVTCYVFLEDLPVGGNVEDQLASCRWFTRGWTLQELLAPKTIEFYDMEWNCRGSKLSFTSIISEITRIPMGILKGTFALRNYGIATRMSWAARRLTTRVEDTAYCLLGIFGVNMPLIYGEGANAFRRLQEEIVKRSSDMTIFAWEPDDLEEEFLGLFAPSPKYFVDSSSIHPFGNDFIEYSVTNQGLRFSGEVVMRVANAKTRDGRPGLRYLLCLGRSPTEGGICLYRIGPRLFYRDGNFPLTGFGKNKILTPGSGYLPADCYFHTDPVPSSIFSPTTFRRGALHIPMHHKFQLSNKAPEALWDVTERVFLRPKPNNWSFYPMIVGMTFRVTLGNAQVDIVIFCDYRKETPFCKIFRRGQYFDQERKLFKGKNLRDSILWEDLDPEARSILDLTNILYVGGEDTTFCISASFEESIVESRSTLVPVFSLNLTILTPSELLNGRKDNVQMVGA